MNRDGEQSAWRRTSCDFNDGRSSVKSSDLKVSNIAHWRFFSGETVSKEAGEAAPRGL